MKPITEAIFKKHFGHAVSVHQGWFGKWTFCDPVTGVKGSVSSRALEVKIPGTATAESYLPFTRLVVDLFCEDDDSSALKEVLADHFARILHLQSKWKLKRIWSPILPKAKAEKTITKERLVWHFDGLGLKSIRRRLFGGFVMRMNSGRRIVFTNVRFDVRGSRTELMPGEPEGYVGSLKYECAKIAQAVWGGFTFPTVKGQELLDAVAIAEECGFTVKDERVLLAKYFGVKAKMKRRWMAGFRIEMPNGTSVHIHGGIQEVNGDSDLYARTLKYGHAVLGSEPLIVSGSQENCLAGIAHADQLGIEIIPELYPKRIFEAISLVTALVCGTAGALYFESLPGFLGGYFGSIFVMPFVVLALSRPMQRSARRRGHLLRSRFPQIHGGDRKAALEEARARGMV
jgi:hypothetical protein